MSTKLTPPTPIISIYSGNMSAVNLCILYSLMVKRIAKGYTTAEVSFLMGHASDFVKDREELLTIGFEMTDIQRYVHALDESGLDGIIFSDLDGKGFSDYQLIKTINPELIQHEMYEILPGDIQSLVFRLFESNPEHSIATYSDSEANANRVSKGILNLLFEGSAFWSAETPMSLYKRCRCAGDASLSPRHVQAALLEMTKQKAFPKLKRFNSKEYGCYYEKVFGRNQSPKI